MIRDLTKLLNRKYVYRSAVDGRFVSRLYALAHPATTYAVRRYGSDIKPQEDAAAVADRLKRENGL